MVLTLKIYGYRCPETSINGTSHLRQYNSRPDIDLRR
jgi:hypothetical protein